MKLNVNLLGLALLVPEVRADTAPLRCDHYWDGATIEDGEKGLPVCHHFTTPHAQYNHEHLIDPTVKPPHTVEEAEAKTVGVCRPASLPRSVDVKKMEYKEIVRYIGLLKHPACPADSVLIKASNPDKLPTEQCFCEAFVHDGIQTPEDIEKAMEKGTPMCVRYEQTWDSAAQEHKAVRTCYATHAEYTMTNQGPPGKGDGVALTDDGGALTFHGCRSDMTLCLHAKDDCRENYGGGSYLEICPEGSIQDRCCHHPGDIHGLDDDGKPIKLGTCCVPTPPHPCEGKEPCKATTCQAAKDQKCITADDGALCLDESIKKLTTTYAFSRCDGLTSAHMPGVENMDDSRDAFQGSSGLTLVDMPKLKTIPANAFQNTGLTEVIMPEVTYIQPAAFDGCWNIATVKPTSPHADFQGGDLLKGKGSGAFKEVECCGPGAATPCKAWCTYSKPDKPKRRGLRGE